MAHKENARREEVTVFTEVEYDFGGTKVTVEVAHFKPTSEADIQLGISNREVSERRAFDEKNK